MVIGPRSCRDDVGSCSRTQRRPRRHDCHYVGQCIHVLGREPLGVAAFRRQHIPSRRELWRLTGVRLRHVGRSEPDDLYFVIDKHGGRNTYAAMLQQALPDGMVVARAEGAARSVYERVHLEARR